MYLSNCKNVFVQIAKCVRPKLTNVFDQIVYQLFSHFTIVWVQLGFLLQPFQCYKSQLPKAISVWFGRKAILLSLCPCCVLSYPWGLNSQLEVLVPFFYPHSFFGISFTQIDRYRSVTFCNYIAKKCTFICPFLSTLGTAQIKNISCASETNVETNLNSYQHKVDCPHWGKQRKLWCNVENIKENTAPNIQCHWPIEEKKNIQCHWLKEEKKYSVPPVIFKNLIWTLGLLRHLDILFRLYVEIYHTIWWKFHKLTWLAHVWNCIHFTWQTFAK